MTVLIEFWGQISCHPHLKIILRICSVNLAESQASFILRAEAEPRGCAKLPQTCQVTTKTGNDKTETENDHKPVTKRCNTTTRRCITTTEIKMTTKRHRITTERRKMTTGTKPDYKEMQHNYQRNANQPQKRKIRDTNDKMKTQLRDAKLLQG